MTSETNFYMKVAHKYSVWEQNLHESLPKQILLILFSYIHPALKNQMQERGHLLM
jgi:hypothetical protein